MVKNALDIAFSGGGRRQLTGMPAKGLRFFGASLTAWSVYACLFSRLDPLTLTILFLTGMLVIIYVTIGARTNSIGTYLPLTDILLAGFSLVCGAYFAWFSEEISSRISLLDDLSKADMFFGSLIAILALEASRRTVGLFLTLLAGILIIYNLFGHELPGAYGHGYISYAHFLDLMVFGTDGLFGAPLRVAATYVYLFVLFGAFLSISGGGQFFHDLAAIFAGTRKGGIAKVALISSGLFGTISGSPTSDVMTTGSMTIPAMIAHRYPARLAGGIEVAASTGGGLLPPVMGSAAFLMAEITGISYANIALSALVPALLYFFTVYTQIHLRSLRLNLAPLEASRIPSISVVFAKGWIFIIPLFLITWALLDGYTPAWAAAYALGAVLVLTVFRSEPLEWAKSVFDAMADSALRIAPVSGACAAAGIIIGCITMTGLAGKFAGFIIDAAGGNVPVILIATALVTLLLGMGMPVPSAYLLAAAVAGSTLIKIGIAELPSHLFILYFSVMSALTPPVAVAAFAASSIANESPFSIAVVAVRLAAGAMIIPFIFIYQPGLLFQGEIIAIFQSILFALGSVFLVAVACEGYLFGKLAAWERVALLCASILSVTGTMQSIVLAIGVAAIAFIRLGIRSIKNL